MVEAVLDSGSHQAHGSWCRRRLCQASPSVLVLLKVIFFYMGKSTIWVIYAGWFSIFFLGDSSRTQAEARSLRSWRVCAIPIWCKRWIISSTPVDLLWCCPTFRALPWRQPWDLRLTSTQPPPHSWQKARQKAFFECFLTPWAICITGESSIVMLGAERNAERIWKAMLYLESYIRVRGIHDVTSVFG